MKAISLWEPWASAIRYLLKRNETRGWYTDYRGPLAICAAKTVDHAEFIHEPSVDPLFRRAGIRTVNDLAFGCVVATCRLKNCLRSEEIRKDLTAEERLFGNYDDGRFVWVLTDIMGLKTPIPFKGSQGFFMVPDDLLANQMALGPIRNVCPFDTNGDGDCGRRFCPYCGRETLL